MKTQGLTEGSELGGFTVTRTEAVPEQRSEATIFTHEKTGARVLHLFNEDPNNLFCVAFRTPVYNNTGVPHILEHSVLSGSRKFPLKDPFKELLKGSLQTFLNAMTYPDKTIYPVSSQVEVDFFNLVDVYCDAVFHPILSEETFLQEGWHFEMDSPSGPAGIKGIVYNEMKGVFSDFRSHVARKSISALLPDTTYFYESGGEPEHIPELTYEDFKEFHRRYYHPSNSYVFLYGNIPSEKTLSFLHDNYLEEFDRLDVDAEITPQPRWSKPRKIEIMAPGGKDVDGTASVVVSWILGDTVDAEGTLAGKILSHYLLGTEGSPLRRALIDSGLGEDLDDASGFEGDLRHNLFSAGLRKAKPENADKIERLVLDVMTDLAGGGIDEELLEGSIRQIEFRLREITDAGSFPHSLMLAERSYRSWIYGGDPLAQVRFEEIIGRIKKAKAGGIQYFADKINEDFVRNPHRLLSVTIASAEEGKRLESLSEKQAQRLTADFTEKDFAQGYEITKHLFEYQSKLPSAQQLASLPRLHKKDLPTQNQLVETDVGRLGDVSYYSHPLFTAGIAYVDLSFDLSTVPFDLLPYLSIYYDVLTRCGAGDYDFRKMATRISLGTGGIGSSSVCATMTGTEDDLLFRGFLHGKVLHDRIDNLFEVFEDILLRPHLDEQKLVKDVLFEMRNDMNASIVRSGHSFASERAGSKLVRSRYIGEIMDGVTQLRFLNGIVRNGDIGQVCRNLRRLHEIVVDGGTVTASITTDKPDPVLERIGTLVGRLPKHGRAVAEIPFSPRVGSAATAIEINSSVNYVAKVWRVLPLRPEAVGTFRLLARSLSTGYLWEKVRVEGGAYGGMASSSGAHPLFTCASYRDPNVSSTLEHFEKGLRIVAEKLPVDEVDQSIIGAVGKIDSPRTPHAKGLGESIARMSGRSPEFRQQMREAVLGATPESLAQTAQSLLETQDMVTVVIGNSAAFDKAEKEGVTWSREELLRETEK